MGYQVIARKYRPQRFSDVVGQEHVIQTLKNAISSGRIAHAYLFAGPRGTGKTTLARIFSKALNCENGPDAEFDLSDPIASDIADGTCLDVIEIDGASNNGVDQIRDLRDTVQYTPNVARFKIYIIDEVHMLSTQAFNALLKTLEEPPEHVKFMFATTEPEKILTTILSRCQRFDLTSIPSEKIAEHLRMIAESEGIEVEPRALDAISRSADGGMRDAESTLDQLISFCGEKVTEPDVLGMFGLAGRNQVMEMAQAIIEANTREALIYLNELVRNGKDLSRLLGDLLNHFRNLLVFTVSDGDLSLLNVTETERETISSQADSLSSFQLTRIIETLAEFETRLKSFSSRKIAMELCLMRAIESRNALDLNHVIGTLEKLQSGEKIEVPTALYQAEPKKSEPKARARSKDTPRVTQEPAPKNAPAPAADAPAADKLSSMPQEKEKPEPAPAPVAPAEPKPSPAPKKKPAPAPAGRKKSEEAETSPQAPSFDWKRLVAKIGESSGILETVLQQAHVSKFSPQRLIIGMDPTIASQIAVINSPKNIKLIQKALDSQGFTRPDVEFVEEPHPDGAPPEIDSEPPKTRRNRRSDAAQPDGASGNAEPTDESQPVEPIKMDPEEFKSDPLIQKALEIFKGQIVEVRNPKE